MLCYATLLLAMTHWVYETSKSSLSLSQDQQAVSFILIPPNLSITLSPYKPPPAVHQSIIEKLEATEQHTYTELRSSPRPLSSFNYQLPSFRLLLTAFASSADPQTPFDGIYQGSCIAPLLRFRFPVPIASHEIPS